MAYIQSSNVQVFPSALRTYETASGKFTSENNLTSMVRSATSRDSYKRVDGANTVLVIHGYRFEVPTVNIPNNRYAHILIDNTGRLCNTGNQGSQLDQSSNFMGLLFDDTQTPAAITNYTWYTLDMQSTGFINSSDIYGTMPVEKGGTGQTSLADVTVGNAINASTAEVAAKLGSATVGGNNNPTYLSSGTPTACNFRVFISDTEPQGNFQNGDIWFQYSISNEV